MSKMATKASEKHMNSQMQHLPNFAFYFGIQPQIRYLRSLLRPEANTVEFCKASSNIYFSSLHSKPWTADPVSY